MMHRQTALVPGLPERPGAGAAGLTWIDRVNLLGTRVTVAAVIDPSEHDRRLTSECGAITDPALLDRLLELSLGLPVPDPVAWAETADQPPGVIDRDADGITVTRRLAPPLAIEDVIVAATARRELRAVQDASLFACFARRWVVTTRHRLSEPVVLEAKLCGVGLLDAEGPVLASEAPARETDGWYWMLCEQVYRRWLSDSARDRASENHAQATGGANSTRAG
jgi:hypothetical protein